MRILDDLSNTKVLVIGDVMIDRYWWGTVNRISPEAPVPVVSLDSTTLTAGGAANVAANIAGLGAKPYLIGISGDDEAAAFLPKIMEDTGIEDFLFFPVKGRFTTLKTRIVAHNQQIARLDQETATDISTDEIEAFLRDIKPLIAETDVVVLSDYAKGFLTADLVPKLIAYANENGKPVLVDPKGKDYSKYAGATILTPNQREAADACGLEIHSPDIVTIAGEKLLHDLSLEAILITQGERGMTLFQTGHEPRNLKASARNVYNVTGAGDTAIGTMAAALGGGLSFFEAAEIANFAAGLVVEQVGTTPITREMLTAETARFQVLST
ncbi:MAG: D-glycero-beta-D-manno-heptose-7-phosphate kinase [Acidobacteria bacterium]|nr:D-glycero-beta-D-manno-heptose-7-phosphate kinase [Acidobacteriota bacterium]